MDFILNCFRKPTKLDAATLECQDASTSGAIIDALKGDAGFGKLSTFEGDAIVQRDEEDAEKLQKGVDASVAAGVLPKLNPPPTYQVIDVLGKTPDDVCDAILKHMGDAANKGGVVVLCCLSGTGKGTTVSRLQARLGPGKTKTWSNGDVFRSLTLLAATWREKNYNPAWDKALTPTRVAEFMGMLEFGKFEGAWDIRVRGLGVDALVSKVKNTTLKAPLVAKNIPTVAERTQGEVVTFAAAAAKKMGDDGLVVLLEGREATVNYIPSPYRYTLTMSDRAVLGQRRAAQRLAAAVLKDVGEGASEEAISASLRKKLNEFLEEVP